MTALLPYGGLTRVKLFKVKVAGLFVVDVVRLPKSKVPSVVVV